MSRCINQMEQIVLPVVIIDHRTCLRLDRDAPFPFNVQLVQHLLVRPRLDRARQFQ